MSWENVKLFLVILRRTPTAILNVCLNLTYTVPQNNNVWNEKNLSKNLFEHLQKKIISALCIILCAKGIFS